MAEPTIRIITQHLTPYYDDKHRLREPVYELYVIEQDGCRIDSFMTKKRAEQALKQLNTKRKQEHEDR